MLPTGDVQLEKCVILCKVKFEKKDGIDYDYSKTISIGTFTDHETAGKFMSEYMDDQDALKKGLEMVFDNPIESIQNWEVADYFSLENIACNWKDHENAVRTTHETGPHY